MSKPIIDQSARDKIKYELGTNFLVEAGAGSGKTTSLVDRMVNLIVTDTSKIQEIVAITFTRKAADELKVRFQSELEKAWKRESDPEAKELLSDALQNIERCFLGTVHSFCAKLLRERPVEANLDLNFKELEEAEDLDLLDEAWQKFLQDLTDTDSEKLKELDELGISIDDLLECLKEMKDYPDVEWVTEEVARPELSTSYHSLINMISEAKRAVPDQEPEKGYDSLQKAIVTALQKDRFINPSNNKDIISVFELFNKSLKPTYNRWSSKEDAKFYEEKITSFVETTIKPLIQRWKEFCHPVVVHFLKSSLIIYARLKKERSLLNYQDLLIHTANLLKGNSEVRHYFQEKYRFLLIDEFQDTDPIQAEIMFYLTSENRPEQVWTSCKPRPGSLFVVGDPKQAIYRFRRADIDTYNRVKQLIQEHGGEVLQLTMNFRTVDTVTKELNQVFKAALPEEETIYQAAYRPLNSFHVDEGGGLGTGIRRISVPADYSRKEEIIQKDAENIALYIEALIKEQGLSAKDFMVLTRYTDGIATYAQTIEGLGIPVSISGEIIIGETREFQELYILLSTFIDPTDEVSFIATLRSIFFGFSDDELYQWKHSKGRFTIYSHIPESLVPETEKKFEAALSELQLFQKWIRSYPPTVAIEKIIEQSGFYPLLLTNTRTARTYKSLLQVIEGLRNYESNHASSYKQILERFKELVFEKTVIINIEEDADAVRVMNVHKAKGLEAHVVFLAHPIKAVKPESFLSKHIKREDTHSLGYFCFTIRNGFQDKEIARPLNWNAYRQEELRYLVEEELRILYVAATRAEKALIISSSAKNNNKNPWNLLFQAGNIQEVDVPESTGKNETKALVPISFEEYYTETYGQLSWLEDSTQLSYDHWTPTKNKDFSDIADIDRESGGGKAWGTLIHDIFEKVVKRQDISNYVKLALEKYDFPKERGQEIFNAIASFQNSHIWNEILEAEMVITEVPFTMTLNPDDPLYEMIKESNQSNHPIMIKGIIDLVYKTADGWVIVDYKTDRPSNEEDFVSLTQFYQSQITFYKKAWESITKEKVVKENLYFTNAPNFQK